MIACLLHPLALPTKSNPIPESDKNIKNQSKGGVVCELLGPEIFLLLHLLHPDRRYQLDQNAKTKNIGSWDLEKRDKNDPCSPIPEIESALSKSQNSWTYSRVLGTRVSSVNSLRNEWPFSSRFSLRKLSTDQGFGWVSSVMVALKLVHNFCCSFFQCF